MMSDDKNNFIQLIGIGDIEQILFWFGAMPLMVWMNCILFR
jgi:hypothetical protein